MRKTDVIKQRAARPGSLHCLGAFKIFTQALGPIGWYNRIGIYSGQDVTGSGAEASLSGKDTAHLRLRKQSYERILTGNVCSGIGRSIVHHNHFVRCFYLADKSIETTRKMALFVPGGYDNTDSH